MPDKDLQHHIQHHLRMGGAQGHGSVAGLCHQHLVQLAHDLTQQDSQGLPANMAQVLEK